MKSKIIVLLATLFFCCGSTVFAQEVNEDVNKVYEEVEKPKFPGGKPKLFEYLCNNLKYPQEAAENGVCGRVVISFVVERDGSLSNFKVHKSVDPLLDREAMRLVKGMPKWKPGKQKGIPVRVKLRMPVDFSMQ